MDTTTDGLKILRENSLVEPSIRNPFVHKLNLKLTDKLLVNLVIFLNFSSFFLLIFGYFFLSLEPREFSWCQFVSYPSL